MVGAVVGWFFGRYVGDLIAGSWPVSQDTTMNNITVVFGLSFGVLGWLVGIGGLTYPLLKMLGREPAPAHPSRSWLRYFRLTEDHKVVGLQYLIGVLVFLFTAGLLAMAIRTELLSPTSHVFGPGTYIAIVGEHGTMMMMMASSAVVGPLGNWLVPLMIGSRRMAYPRVEVFSFWVFAAGYLVIMTALPLGGFTTGWTGYAPLQTQANPGMDAYLVGFTVIGLGMIMAGFNLAATIINYAAPGMTWSRIPNLVWSILATTALLVLATPTLMVAGYLGVLDRTVQTAFYVTEHGGSSFVGEPALVLRSSRGLHHGAAGLRHRHGNPARLHRKPLFAYKVAAAGMIGVSLLSFFVWQHHLFRLGHQPRHEAVVHADDGTHLHSNRAFCIS